MKMKTYGGAIRLFVLSVLVAACGGTREDPTNDVFPDKHTERVLLEHSEVGGAVRIIKYADDGITPVFEEMKMPDGSLKQLFYRADFTVFRILDFHPLEDQEADPKLHRESVMAPDGFTYLSHTGYSLSGQRTERGSRALDGKYLIEYFFEDGQTVQKIAHFESEDYQIEVEQIFDKSGLILKQLDYDHSRNAFIKTTSFDESGYPVFSETVFKREDSGRVIESFFPQTDTVHFIIDISTDDVEIYQGDIAGNLVSKWVISENEMKYTHVTIVDDEEEDVYLQTWTRADANASFRLESVRELDYFEPREGESDWNIRVIVFESEGTHPSGVQLMSYGEYYRKVDTQDFLNDEGMVVKRETGNGHNRWTTITEYDIPRDLYKPLDRKRLEFVPFELPDGVNLPYEVNIQ